MISCHIGKMVGAEAKKQRQQQPPPPAISVDQYREACAVLRPDTMRDACRLLLGSLAADSKNAGDDAGDGLLGLYRRVKSAADVIEKRERQQQQQSGGGGVAGGGPAGGTGSCLNSPVGGSVSAAGAPPPMQLPRARPSMSAVVAAAKTKAGKQRMGGQAPAKRQRMQQHAQQGDEGEAPPEAALSFLKALNQAKPGGSSSSSSVTPPPPPLHGAGGKGSSKGSKGKSSTAFPGAKAGRSQPQPVAGRSRPRKSSSSAAGGGDDDAAGAVRTPSQRNRARTSTAASTSAGGASSSSSQRRILEVGEDCLVNWKADGLKYVAIIKDVEHVEEGDDAGGVVYEVEFDNGEIERVMADDVLSQSDLEEDEGEDE